LVTATVFVNRTRCITRSIITIHIIALFTQFYACFIQFREVFKKGIPSKEVMEDFIERCCLDGLVGTDAEEQFTTALSTLVKNTINPNQDSCKCLFVCLSLVLRCRQQIGLYHDVNMTCVPRFTGTRLFLSKRLTASSYESAVCKTR